MPCVTVTDFQRKFSIPVPRITKTVHICARRLKLKLREISVVFAGERRMRGLNKRYLGHDYVTDVITYSHGEIIICPAAAQRNARRFGSSLKQELVLYVVHGLLHLAGYDDRKPRDIQLMRKMEHKLVQSVIARPEGPKQSIDRLLRRASPSSQ